MEGVKIVFIDIDDTLWWFTRNSEVALASCFEMMGCADRGFNYHVFHGHYEHFNRELWQQYNHGLVAKEVLEVRRFELALGACGCSGDVASLAVAMNSCYLEQLVKQSHLVPGAVELLQYLHSKGFEINVISNGFKGVQECKLEAGGMNRYITHIVLSEDCGVTKPRRGIYDYAMSLSGADARSIVMIGDDPSTDIAGARNAGWRTIYLNMRGESCPIADYTVTSLFEVRELL